MIVSHSRGRHGTVCPYFCCLGRHGKHNDCTKKVVLIETIEEKVQDLYSRVQLAPELRDAIELTLIEELEAISEEARLERTSLEKRQARLLAEQAKLLRAHYADAVPVYLLKSEQQRLDRELGQARQRLQALDSNIDTTRANLASALDYAANAHKAYAGAGPKTRRNLNQFFFTRLIIEDDNSVTAELNEPYAIRLSPHVIQAATRHHATTAATATPRVARTAPGTKKPRRPSGRRGLNYEQMVGVGRGTNNITVVLYEDGSSIGFFGAIPTGVAFASMTLKRRRAPAAGSHTPSLRAYVDAGTGHVSAGVGGPGANVPAYLQTRRRL